MAEQTELLLKYRVDQASVQSALAADKQIQDQLNKTAKAGVTLADVNEKLNKSLAGGLRSAAVDNLTDEFQQVLRETGSVEDALIRVQQKLRDIGATDAEIERVGRSIASIRENADSAGTTARNGVGRALNRAGTQLFMLPDVGPSTDISRGMILAGRAADRLNLSAGTLAGGLGLTTAAVVAIGLAFENFINKPLKEARSNLEGALAANRNYYEALGALTTEQVSAQIQQLRQARPALEQQVAELRTALDSAFEQAAATLGDPVARALFNQMPTGALSESLTEAEAQLQENIQTETRLTQGRAQGVFAANDAAAAEQRLAQARIKGFQDALSAQEQQALLDLELTRMIREGVSGTDASAVTSVEKAINDRLAQAQEEVFAYEHLTQISGLQVNAVKAQIAALEADPYNDNTARIEEMNQVLGIAESQHARYSGRLEELNRIIDMLLPGLGLVRENLQALADATAVSTQTDNYFEALKQEGEIRADIAETMAKIAEFEAEANEKLQDIAAQRAEKLAEIEETKADRLETIAENSGDRIRKIQRDLTRDTATAVGERDALAAHLAKQRAKDALEDQSEADTRALQQLEKTLDKQERSIDKSYERQQQNVINSLAKQVNAQQQGLRQLEVDLQNNQRAQLLIAANGSGGVRIVHEQMWQNVYNTTIGWANALSNGVRSVLTTIATPGAMYGLPPVSGYQPNRNNAPVTQNQLNNTLREYTRQLRGGREISAV